jgi:hypothetical protein
LQKVIEYCISEFEIYDKVRFKNITMILNVVWSVFPTFHENWGKELIVKDTKMKYNDYMEKVKVEEPQEY